MFTDCSYLHLLEPLPQICFLVWGQAQFVHNVYKEITLETYTPWEIFIDYRPVSPPMLHWLRFRLLYSGFGEAKGFAVFK